MQAMKIQAHRFPKVWVLVADGERAKILTLHSVHALSEEKSLQRESVQHLDNREQGRTINSQGGARHKIEPHTDWRQYEKAVFASELAALLEEASKKGEFEKLVVIAPPRSLGDLRAKFNEHVRDKVACEIGKDLAQASLQEIAQAIDAESIQWMS